MSGIRQMTKKQLATLSEYEMCSFSVLRRAVLWERGGGTRRQVFHPDPGRNCDLEGGMNGGRLQTLSHVAACQFQLQRKIGDIQALP